MIALLITSSFYGTALSAAAPRREPAASSLNHQADVCLEPFVEGSAVRCDDVCHLNGPARDSVITPRRRGGYCIGYTGETAEYLVKSEKCIASCCTKDAMPHDEEECAADTAVLKLGLHKFQCDNQEVCFGPRCCDKGEVGTRNNGCSTLLPILCSHTSLDDPSSTMTTCRQSLLQCSRLPGGFVIEKC